MAKLQISEEERLRRSENMKRLHAEGKAGAEFGKLGGRPRNKRSSELVAEKAAEKANEIWTRLHELINDESPKVSLDAIKHIHALEEQERKTYVEEEIRYEQLKHAELLELVAANFSQLFEQGVINFADVIDVEPIEARPAIGTGEIN